MSDIKFIGGLPLTSYVAIVYFVHLQRMVYVTDMQGTN